MHGAASDPSRAPSGLATDPESPAPDAHNFSRHLPPPHTMNDSAASQPLADAAAAAREVLARTTIADVIAREAAEAGAAMYYI